MILLWHTRLGVWAMGVQGGWWGVENGFSKTTCSTTLAKKKKIRSYWKKILSHNESSLPLRCTGWSWKCAVTFLINAAMSFSMLYFSRACVAHSTASCCMSSDMSAFLITAFLSVMVAVAEKKHNTQRTIHQPHRESTLDRLPFLPSRHSKSPPSSPNID